MTHLLSLTNAADKAAVMELNLERIDNAMVFPTAPSFIQALTSIRWSARRGCIASCGVDAESLQDICRRAAPIHWFQRHSGTLETLYKVEYKLFAE